jgi:hypothetical protein
MRASVRSSLAWAAAAVVVASGAGGCKTLNERYIALEVWKYERCFGHLPPGFVPPGAAAPAMAAPGGRVCGQAAPAACAPAPCAQTSGCNECGGMGMAEGGMPMMGPPAGAVSGAPTPAGVTAGRPVIISDELVVP